MTPFPAGPAARLLDLLRNADRGAPVAVKLAVPLLAVLGLMGIAGYALVAPPVLLAELQRAYADRARGLASVVQAEYERDPGDREALGRFLREVIALDESVLRIRIYKVVGGSPAVWASSEPSDLASYQPEPHDLAHLATGETAQHIDTSDGEEVLATIRPLAADATVGIHSSLDPLRRAMEDVTPRIVAVVGAGAILQIASIILALEVVILRPLRRLHRAALRVATGDLSVPLGDAEQPDARDEIAVVAREFDRMVRVVAERQDAAERLATTDGLTGLLNRRSFDARLELEIGRATRLGYPLALSLVDLDGFKALNDSAGHLAGDEALRRVGQALTKAVRRTDVVARYGGDEFAVIHPGCDALAAAVAAARARAAVERLGIPVRRGEADRRGRPLSASVGIAEIGPEGEARSLLAAADSALYRAKASDGLEVAAGMPA